MKWLRASAIPLLAVLGGSAGATDITPPPVTDANGWIVTVGAIGAFAPSYPGSRRLRLYPFPSIAVRRVGEPERFSTPDEGFGFALYDTPTLSIGPVANFVFYRGRPNSMYGLRNVDTTHEVGGFIESNAIDHLRLRAEMRQGVDGHRGFVTAFYADAHDRLGPFRISLGPRLNFGDNRYANAYYSVTLPESVANGGRLPIYQASGGFTSAGGVATVRYDFNDLTSATVFGGGQRLLGSVGQSPIPNIVGSRDQWTAGIAIARSFVIGDPFAGFNFGGLHVP